MRYYHVFIAVFMLSTPVTVLAKVGVEATVESAVPVNTTTQTHLHISWKLLSKDGLPFSADGVFVRLLDVNGKSVETVAESELSTGHDGRYYAYLPITIGSVIGVEIGLAGTVKYPDGRSERADWKFTLANEAEAIELIRTNDLLVEQRSRRAASTPRG